MDRLYDLVLFEQLKALRSEIVEEEWIDPRDVFNNGQLKKLCRTFPLTRNEFLYALNDPERYAQYGERFTAVIRDYLENPPPKITEPLPSFVQEEAVTIGEFLEPINEELQERELPEIKAETITEKLLKLGYMYANDEKGRRFPNSSGRELGIVKNKDNVTYQPTAQILVIGLLYDMGLLPRTTQAHVEQSYDPVLYDRLRGLRREIADANGIKAKDYWRIFKDDELKNLSCAPITFEPGKKLLYGERVMVLIENHRKNPPPQLDEPLPSFLIKGYYCTSLSGFLTSINEELKKRELQEIDTEWLAEHLVELGYLEVKDTHMDDKYFPTKLGEQVGMEDRWINFTETAFLPTAQLFLLGLLYEEKKLP